jgi:hypothetical protein
VDTVSVKPARFTKGNRTVRKQDKDQAHEKAHPDLEYVHYRYSHTNEYESDKLLKKKRGALDQMARPAHSTVRTSSSKKLLIILLYFITKNKKPND